MTPHELFERISVWLGMCDQIQPPLSQSPGVAKIKAAVENDWDNQMLGSAAELEMIKELENTLLGNDLKQAIAFARGKDRSKLPDIERLLRKVQKYMSKNNLT